jgi:hypothetical protein
VPESMPDDGSSLAERLRNIDLIQRALTRAVRAALRQHKQAGNPISVWRDGQVVWLAPDEIPDLPDP